MSSVKGVLPIAKKAFRKPSIPDLPPEPEIIEDIEVIEEDADKAARRRKKKIAKGGRRSTILSGIAAALKKRLGE